MHVEDCVSLTWVSLVVFWRICEPSVVICYTKMLLLAFEDQRANKVLKSTVGIDTKTHLKRNGSIDPVYKSVSSTSKWTRIKRVNALTLRIICLSDQFWLSQQTTIADQLVAALATCPRWTCGCCITAAAVGCLSHEMALHCGDHNLMFVDITESATIPFWSDSIQELLMNMKQQLMLIEQNRFHSFWIVVQ